MPERPQRTVVDLSDPFAEVSFCCEDAERFSQWIDKLVARITQGATKQPTLVQLEKAKVLLVDEYRTARNGATKTHRDRLLNKHGEPCIYGVFIATLERMADITIDPPKISRKHATAGPSVSTRQRQQAQRYAGLPAFETLPDES